VGDDETTDSGNSNNMKVTIADSGAYGGSSEKIIVQSRKICFLQTKQNL